MASCHKLRVDGPLTRDIADVYLKYWRGCLLRESGKWPQRTLSFFDNLKACLNKHGKKPERFSSLNDLTEALGANNHGLRRGLLNIKGVTAPYYELMLWKKEDTRHYSVELPESTEQVNVVMLSGFVLKGWLGFATCDKQCSSGWTAKDTLYCIQDSDAAGFGTISCQLPGP